MVLGARTSPQSSAELRCVRRTRRSGRCWPPRASRLLRGPPGSCAPRAVSFCVETVNEAKNYAGQLCRNAVSTHSHDTSHVQDTF